MIRLDGSNPFFEPHINLILATVSPSSWFLGTLTPRISLGRRRPLFIGHWRSDSSMALERGRVVLIGRRGKFHCLKSALEKNSFIKITLQN